MVAGGRTGIAERLLGALLSTVFGKECIRALHEDLCVTNSGEKKGLGHKDVFQNKRLYPSNTGGRGLKYGGLESLHTSRERK